jgi:hypothetical protein
MERRFFLTNLLVTMSAYGLIIFVYPPDATVLPRMFLLWAAPLFGMLAALLMTRSSLPGRSFGAQVLAMYAVISIYCVVYPQKAIIDTLQYITLVYFLPGAIVALLAGIIARRVMR